MFLKQVRCHYRIWFISDVAVVFRIKNGQMITGQLEIIERLLEHQTVRSCKYIAQWTELFIKVNKSIIRNTTKTLILWYTRTQTRITNISLWHKKMLSMWKRSKRWWHGRWPLTWWWPRRRWPLTCCLVAPWSDDLLWPEIANWHNADDLWPGSDLESDVLWPGDDLGMINLWPGGGLERHLLRV